MEKPTRLLQNHDSLMGLSARASRGSMRGGRHPSLIRTSNPSHVDPGERP